MCQINLNQTNILAVQQLELNNQLVETISARELHQFLEVNTHFKDWINRKVEQLGLEEDMDFVVSAQKRALGLGGALREFSLTLEAAKHISMAERNQKGREARKYFISVESKAKTLVPQLQQQNKQLLDLFLQQNPMYSKIVRYSQLGLNATEVAKLCDTSTSRLLEHRKKLASLNLIDAPQPLGCASKINFTFHELSDIYDRHGAGETLVTIAKHYNCSTVTIANRLKAIKDQGKMNDRAVDQGGMHV